MKTFVWVKVHYKATKETYFKARYGLRLFGNLSLKGRAIFRQKLQNLYTRKRTR